MEGFQQLPPNPLIRQATDLIDQRCDWVTFYRQIFGVYGAVRTLYPTVDRLLQFQSSALHGELLSMLLDLMGQDIEPPLGPEPLRVITVRLPKSLHEGLKCEGHELDRSLNRLCLAKLVKPVGGLVFEAPREV